MPEALLNSMFNAECKWAYPHTPTLCFVSCQASGIIQGSWKAEIRHTLASLPHQWYCEPDPSKVCHPTSVKLTTYSQIYNSEADQDAQLQMWYIKNLWRKGNVITTLFLNIQAAFLNMQKEKLITNMHARNLAPEYCDYVNMILTHIRSNWNSTTTSLCHSPQKMVAARDAPIHAPLHHIQCPAHPNCRLV